MEPILSKQEISDLLSAIKDGKVSLDIDDERGPEPRYIDYKEVNLFQISAQRDSQIRIPNFDIILDSFSQINTISLSNQLQRNFSITRTNLESMPFQDYLLKKEHPGSIGVLNLSPLKHGGLIVYDPLLSFSIIEIMLGASTDNELIKLERELTKIELTVLRSTMEKACTDLNHAFRPITNLQTSLIKIENNPRLVSITDPDAEVIIGTFEVMVSDTTGVMELVFPLATFDPFREQFKDLLNVSTLRGGGWHEIIMNEIQLMTATLVAQSGNLNLSVGEVLDFKEGDIITLDYDLNSPLRILVEEKLKFFAIPGVHNGKKAISITGIYE